jgi:hypothetical protein
VEQKNQEFGPTYKRHMYRTKQPPMKMVRFTLLALITFLSSLSSPAVAVDVDWSMGLRSEDKFLHFGEALGDVSQDVDSNNSSEVRQWPALDSEKGVY